MNHLLFVNCCISPRGDRSRTNTICSAFLDGYRRRHPADAVEIEDLRSEILLPMNMRMLKERDQLASEGEYDNPIFRFARRFQRADRVLIGAPFQDLSYPAQLQLYIEYISVDGICYRRKPGGGTCGCCNAEKLAYLTVGSPPEQDNSIGVEHWRQLSKAFGIPHFEYFYAGGFEQYPGESEELIRTAAAQARRMGEDF